MRVTHGRVVNGAIVADAALPEGAHVAIVVQDDESVFDLEPDDEERIQAAIEELDAGRGEPASELRLLLRGSR
jgi:hypothetical protein